ncbi:TetR/AcrR family transcriptional regulator [Dorea longicatena]|nr:TetR/AcrR family transcriptional regulator [Dorea longicatena]
MRGTEMPTERFYRISEQKRRKIGEAIIQEIQQRGYRSIQLGKIASKANISRASLYTYFENKDDTVVL